MLLRTRYRLVTLLCAGVLLCGSMYTFNMIAYVDELCKQRLAAVQSESKNEVSEAARTIVALERDLRAAQGRVSELELAAPEAKRGHTADQAVAAVPSTPGQPRPPPPPSPPPFGLTPARLPHDIPPPPPAVHLADLPPLVPTAAPTASQNSMATAGIVIITCCRADYLERTLKGVFENMDGHAPTVYVSQDKQQPDVTRVIQEWVSSHGVVWLRHPPADLSDVPPNQGRTYHLIARHVGWAIGQLFDVHQHSKAIIIEDDIQIAPDFFSFMGATAPLLYEDPTLFCVSAWNDNGQKGRVYDSEALYRSDFFPGLGWLLTADLWSEIGPKWPKGYWDDWLREPANRRGRACIRPEVSRTFTFGEEGSSNGQFYREFLSSIYLNDIEHKVDWASKDLSYLLKRNYDPAFTAKVAKATATSLAQFLALPAVSKLCSVGTSCDDNTRELRVEYAPGVHGEYPTLARQLNIMTDEKAGVWRTAYGGVVSLRREGVKLYIVPRGFDSIH